jgi:hypothetical protein
MLSRMEELADFFEANLEDPKVFVIEKLRLKLRKALM